MIPKKFKRKLAAILSKDVKGYSRLMGEDEEGDNILGGWVNIAARLEGLADAKNC